VMRQLRADLLCVRQLRTNSRPALVGFAPEGLGKGAPARRLTLFGRLEVRGRRDRLVLGRLGGV
jgi:hypothetical protein